MSPSSIDTFEYKAEMKQLLHLIIHSLYTHPEVFLRELISNSSDALSKVRFEQLTDQELIDRDQELAIRIDVDEKKHSFSITDNGIGMTKDELISNIGTVARSGTLEFLATLKEQGQNIDDSLIGQFGVGFYSVFMVTDEVTIETRHAKGDSQAYRWTSRGEGTFEIEEIDKKERGTTISFVLKDGASNFSEEQHVTSIITKYSNFADFPIYVKDKKINTVEALWRKKQSDVQENELNEFYKFMCNDFENPLGHVHFSVEGAVVNFKALLFIPSRAPFDLRQIHEEKNISLYANKILIQSGCKELLPEYLRFVKGVVDTIDLPLNVSREVTQSSPLMMKIRNILTSKLLNLFKEWAEKDTEKYAAFHKNFGVLLKTGLNSDFENKDKLVELFRFESSAKPKGEAVSLKEYVSRMKDDQKEIYYLAGDHRDALERNPNLEYFKKNDIEVLLLTDPIDVFTVPGIGTYDGKSIAAADNADLDVLPASKIQKPDEAFSEAILKLFKETLADKVEDVIASKRLVDSPVTLVSGKEGMNVQMEKMMKVMNKDFVGSKRVMEVNLDHALIRNLSRMFIANSGNPVLRKCIEQLYESALFIDGNLTPSTDFVQRMVEIMEEATK